MKDDININGYEQSYSDDRFFSKVEKFAKKAGISVIYAGLLLYEVLKTNNVSTADKAIILGTLGYFISPLDFIPDLTPVLGFSDDLTAFGIALSKIKGHITPDIMDKVKVRLKKWFPNFNDIDLKEIEKFL